MTFQELILSLESFWARHGCVIQQPYDIEVGAGTSNPATFLRVLQGREKRGEAFGEVVDGDGERREQSDAKESPAFDGVAVIVGGGERRGW